MTSNQLATIKTAATMLPALRVEMQANPLARVQAGDLAVEVKGLGSKFYAGVYSGSGDEEVVVMCSGFYDTATVAINKLSAGISRTLNA